MRLATLAICATLVAFPAMAQQQGGGNSVLNTLEGALNQLGGQRGGTNNQSLDVRNLPHDQSGRVDVGRLNDDQLRQYDEELSRRGRQIAQELRDTQREMQARNMDQNGYSGSSSRSGRSGEGSYGGSRSR